MDSHLAFCTLKEQPVGVHRLFKPSFIRANSSCGYVTLRVHYGVVENPYHMTIFYDEETYKNFIALGELGAPIHAVWPAARNVSLYELFGEKEAKLLAFVLTKHAPGYKVPETRNFATSTTQHHWFVLTRITALPLPPDRLRPSLMQACENMITQLHANFAHGENRRIYFVVREDLWEDECVPGKIVVVFPLQQTDAFDNLLRTRDKHTSMVKGSLFVF